MFHGLWAGARGMDTGVACSIKAGWVPCPATHVQCCAFCVTCFCCSMSSLSVKSWVSVERWYYCSGLQHHRVHGVHVPADAQGRRGAGGEAMGHRMISLQTLLRLQGS